MFLLYFFNLFFLKKDSLTLHLYMSYQEVYSLSFHKRYVKNIGPPRIHHVACPCVNVSQTSLSGCILLRLMENQYGFCVAVSNICIVNQLYYRDMEIKSRGCVTLFRSHINRERKQKAELSAVRLLLEPPGQRSFLLVLFYFSNSNDSIEKASLTGIQAGGSEESDLHTDTKKWRLFAFKPSCNHDLYLEISFLMPS